MALFGCALLIRPNSYDHKRSVHEDAVAAENRTQPLRVWGFIIRRFDGTSNYSAPPVAQYGPRGGILCRGSYRTSSNTKKGGMAKATAQGRFRGTYIREPKGNLKFDPERGCGLPPHKKTIEARPRKGQHLTPNRSCGRGRPLHQTAVAVVGEHYSRLVGYASRRH